MFGLKTTAFKYHAQPRPGKLSVELIKPAVIARDLSLIYGPGVVESVHETACDAELAYQYTGKGNLVAAISGGAAILDLGNPDPLASKPVMEGKGVLFKHFTGIGVLDIKVDTESPQTFIDTIRHISVTFGGINLEDAKASEYFGIERALIEQCDTPVFHDGQHSTAIVAAADMFNALELAEKKLGEVKIVCLSAGTTAISCMKLLVNMGAKVENIYMVDRRSVAHADRNDLNQYKSAFATEADKRTLTDALGDADVFVGLPGASLLEPEDLKHMASNPIVFACSNPDPEIKPELARATRNDVIMATGRSDYPNQINNVFGFPFIFRGTLDIRATRISEEMKIATTLILRDLAKQPVPKGVCTVYGADKLGPGREHIIPEPMDKRLITVVSDTVTKATIETSVATLPYPEDYPLKSVDKVFND